MHWHGKNWAPICVRTVVNNAVYVYFVLGYLLQSSCSTNPACSGLEQSRLLLDHGQTPSSLAEDTKGDFWTIPMWSTGFNLKRLNFTLMYYWVGRFNSLMSWEMGRFSRKVFIWEAGCTVSVLTIHTHSTLLRMLGSFRGFYLATSGFRIGLFVSQHRVLKGRFLEPERDLKHEPKA